MLGVRLSLAPALKELQVGHRCDALPVEVWITLEKTVVRVFSAQDAEQGLMPQKCACVPTKTGMSNTICIYCGSTNYTSNRCCDRPNDNIKEPRSTPRDLGEHGTGNTHKGFRTTSGNSLGFKQAILT